MNHPNRSSVDNTRVDAAMVLAGVPLNARHRALMRRANEIGLTLTYQALARESPYGVARVVTRWNIYEGTEARRFGDAESLGYAGDVWSVAAWLSGYERGHLAGAGKAFSASVRASLGLSAAVESDS